MSFAFLNLFLLFYIMDCAPYAPSLLESTKFRTKAAMSFIVEDKGYTFLHRLYTGYNLAVLDFWISTYFLSYRHFKFYPIYSIEGK